MGRFLDIALSMPYLEKAPAASAIIQTQQAEHSISGHTGIGENNSNTPYDINDLYDISHATKDWNQAASDVLDVIVKAGRPILHSQMVKQLARRGQSKEAAKTAIASCQQRGWTAHNLVDGYILSDCTDNEQVETQKDTRNEI